MIFHIHRPPPHHFGRADANRRRPTQRVDSPVKAAIIPRVTSWVFFLVGLGAGVLLNSLADNLPPDSQGVRRMPARPHCRTCGAPHAPVYWLALVSVLTRAGRCEHCSAPRPVRQAVVEVVTGLSWAYAWNWAGGPTHGLFDSAGKFFAGVIVLLVFILITVIDIEHRLVLHIVSLPAAVTCSLIGFLTPGRGPMKTLLGGLAGYGLVLGIFLLGQVFSLGVAWLRGRPLDEVAFGGGDVNLAGVVGLTVGWPGVLLALFVAVMASSVFSVGYILVQSVRRRYTLFTPLPYGPFLALGALLVYFFGKPLATWYLGH